jgi:hypothetical protein
VKGRRRPARWAAQVVLAISVASVPALADVTKDQCIDANGKAQELRRGGRLAAAREQLRMCDSPSCPAMVRDDCTKRLDDLEKAQPTVAFEVKDESGADVSAVKVTVDGTPLTDRLDGTALPADIGEHVFTFEVIGHAPVTRKLVLTEGEKGRRERVVLGTALPAAPVPAASPATPVQPSPEPTAPSLSSDSPATEAPSSGGGMGTQRVLGLVAGAMGVAGVAVGGVFGILTISQKSNQQSDCGSPACSASGHAAALADHSDGMTDSTISTVAFIAGGVFLAGGAALFFTEGSAPRPPAAAGMLLLPGVGPGGGGMLLRGEF